MTLLAEPRDAARLISEQPIDLFAFFGIPSVSHRPPARRTHMSSQSGKNVYKGGQEPFPFMHNDCHRLVPKSMFVYLNYEIGDFFGYKRALFNMAMRLYDDLGIIYIGEFISFSQDQLLPYVRNNHELLRTVERDLSKVGLGLNSKVVGWHGTERRSARRPHASPPAREPKNTVVQLHPRNGDSMRPPSPA
jgi:hypothetical protein